jgi:hypothetical protein
MIGKTKTKRQPDRTHAKVKHLKSVGPDLNQAEAENVQYFLRALNQISLALHELGYVQEGAALAQVRVDLHQRIFRSPTKPADILRILH